MPKITIGGFNNPCLEEEILIQKHSPIVTGTQEYSSNHNSFIRAYFGKLFMGYLIGGSMNKTHILFFKYSTWFDNKIHLNIHVLILQYLDKISFSDPATTRNELATTGMNLQQQEMNLKLLNHLTFDKTIIGKT